MKVLQVGLFVSLIVVAGVPPVRGQQESATLKMPEGMPEEVREALTWFDSLALPSSRGMERVRVTTSWVQLKSGVKGEWDVDGWLVEEKDGKWRIRCGPDVEGPFAMDADTPWPLDEWTVSAYSKTETEWKSERTVQKKDFKAEAEERLTALKTPRDPEKESDRISHRHGMILSGRAATFIMGRDCLEHGLPEMGLEFLKLAPPMMRDANDRRTFRQLLEDEFARAALWKVTLEFSVPAIPRETLLTNAEAALKRFPNARDAEELKAMADRLRTMVTEDKDHAAKVKPLEGMTPAEQAAELVFQLRNQTGRQDSQPGQCDIFSVGFAGGFTGPRVGKVTDATPAGKLVKLGYAAVPALIEALTSETYSRAVGFWRDFRFSHSVLTVGDCAQQTLEEIAGRSFYTRKTTSGYMSLDEKTAGTKAEVEKWWHAVRDKGERQALIDAVKAADETSPSQAYLLKQRYPDDAAAVVLQAARDCKDSWARTQMIYLLRDLKSEPVTAFLKTEMIEGPHADSRRAAVNAMLTLDLKAAQRAMLEEWTRLTGQFSGNERYHVMLHKYIGEKGEFDIHEWTERLSGLLLMIYATGGVETIAGVVSGYEKKPGWIRSLMIQKTAWEEVQSAKEDIPDELETERKKSDAALEKLLLQALDDRTDRHCDDAAKILHDRWPTKYEWVETESVRRRDAQIIAIKNVRRKELGQAALAVADGVKISPVREAEVKPLLEALAGAKDEAAVVSAIEALAAGPGLAAIPLVAKRVNALPKDDPQAARWQRAARALASIVREVEADPKAKFISALPEVAALKGRVLTPELLQKTLVALYHATPGAVAGFHVRADRDDDGSGFVVRVMALTEKSSQANDWWALHYAGNEPCRDMDGSGRGFYGNDFAGQADGFEELKSDFVKACATWNRAVYVNYRVARQER